MTYSICVRERAAEGHRFGVAAAGRLPAVGGVATHASAHGAVAVGGVADAALGDRCLSALGTGRRVDDVVDELTAEDGANRRQIHGVGATASAAHTGAACPEVAGDRVSAACTVAGTSLVDAAVLDAVERGYRENERDAPLPRRLLTALAAGEREGGDRRTDLPTGSAAVAVASPGATPLYHDLRVDASETPVADLRETYRRAKRGYEVALERYDQTEKS